MIGKRDNFTTLLLVQMLSSEKKWCATVPKREGERIRKELAKQNAIDERYEIKERNGRLYIPLKGDPNECDYEVVPCSPKQRPHALPKKLGISYDVIGDIAIIDWFDGAQATSAELLETRKNIKVVIAALSGVRGEYRLKDFKFVAGERRTVTEYKEFGSKMLIDVSSVYFSPRLATERHRVAQLTQPNETIADMFAGVGPYTILLAKRVEKVVAFELNPSAFCFLEKNLKLNKLHNVKACLGNAKDLAPKFAGIAERVIMNLPHSAFNFLGDALTMLSANGGFIHYYDVKPEEQFREIVERVKKAVESRGRAIETIYLKKVRSYAPRRFHVVLDIKISPY